MVSTIGHHVTVQPPTDCAAVGWSAGALCYVPETLVRPHYAEFNSLAEEFGVEDGGERGPVIFYQDRL